VKKKLITKAIQTSIDNHCDFVWIQDHLNNIFLCRISFHENGREIIKKFATFYIPEELAQAIELHHAVFDAIKDRRNKPLISAVLGNFVWRGLVEPFVLSREADRERAEQGLHPTSGSLPDLQAVSTPQPLASSQALSTPPTCG
jgi:hypothetical protein